MPAEFIRLLQSVKAKRPRTMIEHILKHGHITTEEISEIYGYNHPPRAIRDVREHGIPIETYRVTASDGRSIAGYRFGDPSQIPNPNLAGRTVFSRQLKTLLIEAHGEICNIYLEATPEQELQIDHRVPFHIAGSQISESMEDYQLLCPSANRMKSWSCENCSNWLEMKARVCHTCYWAYPETYQHVAMRDVRRLDLIWSGDEVTEYESLRKRTERNRLEMASYVKKLLRSHMKNTANLDD